MLGEAIIGHHGYRELFLEIDDNHLLFRVSQQKNRKGDCIIFLKKEQIKNLISQLEESLNHLD